MATPWRHPNTKVFYLYRQVPAAIRPVIGRTFWKASLRTRDPVEAARLFTAANAELEQRFADARRALAEQAAKEEISAERAEQAVATFLRKTASPKHARWPSLELTWWLQEAAEQLLGGVAASGLPVLDDDGRVAAAA